MTLHQQIIDALPELAENPKIFATGIIVLQDDADGLGAYIREWNYEKPLPKGLSIGK
jgi:hypothetical protein